MRVTEKTLREAIASINETLKGRRTGNRIELNCSYGYYQIHHYTAKGKEETLQGSLESGSAKEIHYWLMGLRAGLQLGKRHKRY